jgi:hypothetical protein
LEDDPSTFFAYPTVWNFCALANPSQPPKIDHQKAFCLGTEKNYYSCPLLLQIEEERFPIEASAPK